MALAKDLIGLGMPWSQATALGFGDEATGLSATGTSSANALTLTASINQFSTVNSGTGATLPVGTDMAACINNGANALLAYPGAGQQINNATATTGGYSIAAGKTALFIKAGLRWLATLST